MARDGVVDVVGMVGCLYGAVLGDASKVATFEGVSGGIAFSCLGGGGGGE